jgi:hypothetical protein
VRRASPCGREETARGTEATTRSRYEASKGRAGARPFLIPLIKKRLRTHSDAEAIREEGMSFYGR